MNVRQCANVPYCLIACVVGWVGGLKRLIVKVGSGLIFCYFKLVFVLC